MNKKIVYGGASVLVLVVAVTASMYLVKAKPLPKKNNAVRNTMYVQAKKANQIESESSMLYYGRVTAYENISLASEVQGIILKGDVRFKEGESFNKGDVLIRIYSETTEASLKSGKSTFLQTLSNILPDLKIDYSSEYEKWNNYFNSIDMEKTLPKLPSINSNKEKVFLASNNVLTTYYNLQQQEITLKKHTIRAPFNGSFTSVNREIGAIASNGVELATIIRSDKLEVTVPVFPNDLKWIHEGDVAQMVSINGDKKEAKVSRISGFVDAASQSVNVFLTYNTNNKNSFLHGQYVDVIFRSAKVTGIEIPREALIDDHYVYELTNKKLKKLRVDVLRRLNDTYIISGIDSTKVIVSESLASINENTDYLAR